MNVPGHLVSDGSSLEGQVAVVTGANGGMGSAVVERLASRGALVVPLDIERPDVGQFAAEIGLSLACDISDEDAVVQAAQAVATKFGRCDILVNNAGILPAPVPLEDVPSAQWDRVFAVNARGPFLCTKAFGRLMLNRKRGAIVNVASIAATTPNSTGPYGPSKAAVLALTRQTAVEWGPRGIRANSVSPGMVRTPMTEHVYQDQAAVDIRTRNVPSRRIGSPSELAGAIAFLASDGASYINGQELIVDGGLLVTTLINLASH